MREYSATSVSKADASSLADKLTEQSRDGWELVEIVRTDDEVVAYLSRESTGGSTPSRTPTHSYDTTTGSTQDSRSGDDKSANDAPTPAGGYVVTESVAAVTDNVGNTFVTDEAVATPAATSDGVGWAAGSGAAGAMSGMSNQASDAAQQSADSAQHAVSDGAGQAAGAVASAGASAPNASTDASSGADLAPAGWYADPAGRFDLRYWDGAQWTEHVARNGHQETDPPIR